MKKISFILYCFCIINCFFAVKANATFVTPLETETPEIEESDEAIYSVLIRADIPNGITDNISFCLNMKNGDDVDTCKYVLLRMNKFQTRLQLYEGDYTITNINVYDDEIQTEDISFTIDKSCSGKGTEIVIPIAGGSSEEVNTEFKDKHGIKATPHITITEKPTNTLSPTSIPEKIEEKKEFPLWAKRVITYGILIGIGVVVYFGYKKCKELWNS